MIGGYNNRGNHAKWFWREHDRGSYECPDCGETGGPFDVHHKDGNVGNGSIENLVALCSECHQERHQEIEDNDEPEVEGWKRGFRQELMKG